MDHNPVNHPLRPLYRAIGGLVGLYMIVFGLVGLIGGTGSDHRVLGQGASAAWAVLSLIIGAIVLGAILLGRNLDNQVDKYLGWGLLVVGSYGLATIRTNANVLDFTISTIVVAYLLGLALIMIGLYSKTGPADADAHVAHETRVSA